MIDLIRSGNLFGGHLPFMQCLLGTFNVTCAFPYCPIRVSP